MKNEKIKVLELLTGKEKSMSLVGFKSLPVDRDRNGKPIEPETRKGFQLISVDGQVIKTEVPIVQAKGITRDQIDAQIAALQAHKEKLPEKEEAPTDPITGEPEDSAPQTAESVMKLMKRKEIVSKIPADVAEKYQSEINKCKSTESLIEFMKDKLTIEQLNA